MIGWLVERRYFRNANHAIWFLLSLMVLGLVVAYYFLPKFSWVWLLPPAVMHVSPIIISHKLRKRRQPSDLYSEDCVWFNTAMIVIYLIIGFVVIKR